MLSHHLDPENSPKMPAAYKLESLTKLHRRVERRFK